MTRSIRALRRALITAALVCAGLWAGTAPAWAHVHVAADDTVRGGSAVLSFEVPGESDTGALTTQFSVGLPNGTPARAELMPGWTARLDRDTAAGTVRSVTWTAAPGVGISPEQFALFRVSLTLPNSDTAPFPATQTYSDGTVVRWDQPPLPGGGEPDHPLPALTLTAAPAAAAEHRNTASGPDNTARWLAGAGLIIAVLGVGLALAARRRS
jgi:uncharacterized protein YcnI